MNPQLVGSILELAVPGVRPLQRPESLHRLEQSVLMFAHHVVSKEVHDVKHVLHVDFLLVSAGEDRVVAHGLVGHLLRRRELEDLGPEAGVDAPVVAHKLNGGKEAVQFAGFSVRTEDVGH